MEWPVKFLDKPSTSKELNLQWAKANAIWKGQIKLTFTCILLVNKLISSHSNNVKHTLAQSKVPLYNGFLTD